MKRLPDCWRREVSRISRRFSELRERGEGALVPFITGGDPGILATDPLVLEMEAAGADIVEIGIPFSDPLADGPSNQAAYHRALLRGVTAADVLAAVARIRQVSDIPLVLMTYYNPVLHYGLDSFAEDAAAAGVDTATDYRRRGFARRVVAAWAADVMNGGRTAFYSTTWENTASRAIARGLGLRFFGEDCQIT